MQEILPVGAMQAIISGVMTIFFYAVVIAAVWKIFQATSELMEIKKLLVDIRHNTSSPAATPVVAAVVPVAVAQPVVAPVVPTPAVAAAPVAAAPPPVMSGPISLEAAEALLREVGAESEALERAHSRS